MSLKSCYVALVQVLQGGALLAYIYEKSKVTLTVNNPNVTCQQITHAATRALQKESNATAKATKKKQQTTQQQ